MKKNIYLICCVLLASIWLTGCCFKHDWEEATCEKPQTCSNCGATEGGMLDHKWKEATCEEPKTCEMCGKQKGEALGHVWEEATCNTPKTCSVCGETVGDANGHSWADSTCVEPRFCYVCGESDGVMGEHTWRAANCTSPETCRCCGETRGEATKHVWCGTDSDVYCSECRMDLPENSFTSGKVLFKGVSFTLTSDYYVSNGTDYYNGMYSNNKAMFTIAPYWNMMLTEQDAIKIGRDKAAEAYELGDEYYCIFEDNDEYEFYVIEICYEDKFTGFCTVFWREDLFVYMECLSTDPDYINDYYEEVMNSFDVM